MLHAIRLDFDPAISPFGLTVRLETLALAGAILLALVAAGVLAGRARAAAERDAPGSDESRLRRDDLILIAFGAVPGAVVGGRLGYGLIHLDFYGSDPGALLDPGKGSLSLTAALLLGTATALAVARLVGAPLRAWLHLAATPLLLGLGLGKLATVLGGSGQGAFSDASWATAYVAPGRWGSLDAADPAIPSQAIEGCLVLLVLAGLVLLPQLLRLRAVRSPRPGLRLVPAREWLLVAGASRFATALALWAAVRFGVAFTWRDGRVVGPLGVEQLGLAILIFAWAWVQIRPWAAAALSRRAERRAVIGAERAARRETERQAKLEANRQAQLEKESQAQLEKERQAKLEAERAARRETERQAKLEAKRQAQLEKERQAQLEKERKARLEVERNAKLAADLLARLEAKRQAQLEKERQAQLEKERKAKLEAERKAQREAKRQAKLEAKRQAQLEKERKAQLEIQRKAQLEADRLARIEAERQAKRLAALEAVLEAKRKARLEAQQAKLAAEHRAAVPEAEPEYPREESGSEVQVVPERDGVEPAKRPTRRGTHRPRAPGSRRQPPGSGS